MEHHRLALRSLHGAGKTAMAAWVVLWGIAVFDDVKVVTTASAWRQLTFYLWPEIRKWANQTNWAQLGLTVRRNHELLDLSIKLPGREAFAVASDNPALIEGAHASNLIYVLDEAKAIPADTWDAVEGAFSTGNCYVFALSTPGAASGRFYSIHSRQRGYEDWHIRHISLEDAISAGRVRSEWAEQRKSQWGENSPLYQNRVEGNFADSSEDSLIPLSWTEQAVERWHVCGGIGAGDQAYGVDPARFGDDKTTIAHVVGHVCQFIKAHTKEDTMQTAGRVAALADPTIPVAIDTIGVGAGVYDRLREMGYRVIGVNVAEATQRTDSSGEIHFDNLRAALWWLLREMLDPTNPDAIAIPPDAENELIGDLTAPTYTYTSRGRIRVESKDDIRKRLGRSTDYADALALAFYALSRPAMGNVTVLRQGK